MARAVTAWRPRENHTEHFTIHAIRRLAPLLVAAALVACSTSVVPPSLGSVETPPSTIAPGSMPPHDGATPSPSSADDSASTLEPDASAVDVTPAPSPMPTVLPPIPEGAVPILYYHRVQAVPPDFATWDHARQRAFLAYDTLPAAFEAQLDWLIHHGYTTILPRDLAAYWDAGERLPKHPVILTFDDGFPSWVTTVLPMLRKRSMVAEFYLTLDAIASKTLRWSDVRRLATAGNGIGAHDVHHVQLAGLPGGRAATAEVMWHEINDIRSVIKAQVGTAPDSMAYVGGGFDATLVDLVKQAGYSTARSILRGIVQSRADRFTLRVVRIGVYDDVIDPVTETLVDGLPTFTARMHWVSDLRP